MPGARYPEALTFERPYKIQIGDHINDYNNDDVKGENVKGYAKSRRRHFFMSWFQSLVAGKQINDPARTPSDRNDLQTHALVRSYPRRKHITPNKIFRPRSG
jgi:hypothetical protein